MNLFVTCAAGFESLLADELNELGLRDVRVSRMGVYARGDVPTALKTALWSRVAGRVLLTLCSGPCKSLEDLYAMARTVAWQDHVPPRTSIAVEVHGSGGVFRDTRIVGLKVKDALVDVVRDHCGSRPDVNKQSPDLRIHVALKGPEVTISLDLGGGPLHERGYRQRSVDAPIKENLAAAILLRLEWPKFAEAGASFVDVMCGSGTFLIEAAWMAMNRAPGLDRANSAAASWLGSRSDLWETLKTEARASMVSASQVFRGFDRDERAVRACRMNLSRAGVEGDVSAARRSVEQWPDFELPVPGLLVSNPLMAYG